MDPHYSIGVDTSHSRGQLCFFENQKLIKNIFWEKKGSHSERLNLYFQETLNELSINLKQINNIFCSIGPGSFTGLRVGINFCKTLAYAHNIPLFPISTLQALAYLCPHSDKNIISTIDAQKNAIFISKFDSKMNPLKENLLLPINQLETFFKENSYLCGSGIEKYKEHINKNLLALFDSSDKWSHPDISKIIAVHFSHKLLKKVSWTELQPLYIRLSSAEEKLNLTRPKS